MKWVDELKWEAAQHWLENWEQGVYAADIYSDSCVFCNEYLHTATGKCYGCPVKEVTGLDLCQGTPWVGCNRNRLLSKCGNTAAAGEFKIDSEKEYRFLVCLALGDPEDLEEAREICKPYATI